MVIDKCCQDGRRVKKNVHWGNQQVDNGVSWELLLASDVWSAVTIPWAVCQQIHCFFSLTSKFLETNQQTFVVFLYWLHVITVVSPKKIMMYTYIIYIHIICVFIYACIIFAGPTLFHTKLCSKNLQILLDPLPGTSINGFWLSSSTASQSPWWKPQKQKVRQVGSEQWPEHLFPSFVVFLLYSESRLFVVFFEAILLKVKTNGTECIKKLEGFLIVVSPMVLGSGHDFVGRHHVRGPSCDLTYRSIHSSGRKPMRLCGKKHHFWMPIRMFY